MQKAGIPTAQFCEFSDAEKALIFINECQWKEGMVVKLDGLAAGKGVVVCQDKTKPVRHQRIDAR